MAEGQQQKIEQVQPNTETISAGKDGAGKKFESVDFKQLNVKNKKEEKAQAKVMSDIGSINSGTQTQQKNISIKEIEKVLSNDLEDVYFQMSPELQEEFKVKGEETAHKVSEILKKSSINIKKIAKLIMNWLKIIPGVNKFFLEQESKIKTDEVLKLK